MYKRSEQQQTILIFRIPAVIRESAAMEMKIVEKPLGSGYIIRYRNEIG